MNFVFVTLNLMDVLLIVPTGHSPRGLRGQMGLGPEPLYKVNVHICFLKGIALS